MDYDKIFDSIELDTWLNAESEQKIHSQYLISTLEYPTDGNTYSLANPSYSYT